MEIKIKTSELQDMVSKVIKCSSNNKLLPLTSLMSIKVESNFLTPNMVGNKINLHPLWIIFALFSGGALFGLTGMLIALPIASVIGVVVRFYIKEKITYIKEDE